jgi:hypothetical protein
MCNVWKKNNPDIHLMCEVPVIVNVYRAECSLSDSDSHYFPNNSPWSLFNVSLTKREQIAKNIRVTNEKRSAKFKENWSLPDMRFYLGTSLEILNKKAMNDRKTTFRPLSVFSE